MSGRRGGTRVVATLLAALSLLVSACSQAPGGEQPGASQSGSQGQVDPNGEITLNTGGEPDTIDPQKASFVNEIAQAAFVFEGLITFDAKTTRPVPAAAAKLPEVSADGLRYKYTLRDGLKYSDGERLTAKNFEYSFLRGCDPSQSGDYAIVLYVIVGCETWNTMDPRKAGPAELTAARARVGIRAISDSEIEFTLTDPAPFFVAITALWIGWPVRESDVRKGGDRWTEPATYIGNGPFKLTQWQHNEKMVFERNDNYRKKIQLKRVTKVMINESSVAFASYRTSELDMVGVGPQDLRTVQADPELKSQLVETGGSCTNYYGFNVRRPPFDDVNIRLAFAKSFDRDAFVKNVQQGIGKAADGGFIPPAFPGYDSTDTEQRYDPAAARALLDRSSAASKAGLVGLKFTYPASSTNKTRAEWAQQQWKANIGVMIELDPVQGTAYTALFKKGQEAPQLFSLGWCADFPDQQNWHSTVWLTGGLSAARTGYSSRAFDELTRRADREPDPAKRDALYNQAGRQLSKDAPAAWVYYDAGRRLQKPWLRGITDNALDYGIPGYFALENVFVVKH
jgi:oligopeptide transport system substrate-binding protein